MLIKSHWGGVAAALRKKQVKVVEINTKLIEENFYFRSEGLKDIH